MGNETTCDICGFAINGAIFGSSTGFNGPRQACGQCWDKTLIEQANQLLIEQEKKTRLACIQAIQRRLDASEDIDGYVEGLESAIHIIEELGAIKHSINVDGSCNLGCC